MEWKDKGNEKFKAGDFAAALDCYCKAIEIDKDNAVLYSNRSATHLKLKNFDEALRDAETCVKLQPNWDKGHFRKGSALEQKDIRQALAAYESGLACNLENIELGRKVTTLRQQMRAQDQASANARKKTHGHDKGHAQGRSARHEQPSTFANTAGANFANIPGMPPGMGRPPPPSGWAKGLSPAKQREWLVDCYRMRTDDTYVYSGELVGLYSAVADGDNGAVLLDFLVFCKLAVVHGVIPQGWDWDAFLQVAAGLLHFAFEKSDASEKWGGENVFMAMTGGRSLRYTGEAVYGSGVMSAGQMHTDEKTVRDELGGHEWADLFRRPAASAIFRNVGGAAAWQKLETDMVYP